MERGKRKMMKRKRNMKRKHKCKRAKYRHLATQFSAPPALIPTPSLLSGERRKVKGENKKNKMKKDTL